MEEYDGPDGELISPEDLLARRPMPVDARRLGLDHNTQEGAMLALASSLNPARTSHRVIAWILLVAVAAPVLLRLLSLIF
jgi:hypothetical protein